MHQSLHSPPLSSLTKQLRCQAAVLVAKSAAEAEAVQDRLVLVKTQVARRVKHEEAMTKAQAKDGFQPAVVDQLRMVESSLRREQEIDTLAIDAKLARQLKSVMTQQNDRLGEGGGGL